MLSGVSQMSQMSQMTRFSTLSIDTRMSLQTNHEEIYGSQYLQASASPLMASRENWDPNQAAMALFDLLQVMSNENEIIEERMHALSALHQRIKNSFDAYSMDDQFKLQVIWGALHLSAGLGPYLGVSFAHFRHFKGRILSRNK